MSGIPSTSDSVTLDSASTLGRIAFEPVETIAFWSAVALPLVYLPLLAGGFESGQFTLFIGLIALHVAMLALGRGHGQE
ncbi:hypothetical protein C440_00870 [Haloferax mucosum ATCC BAA-1512]|uniref:Uncharacterized protein n=1 Tax=Haloferax mucosum ATCC BAA-1512 TaxID=662479 RepID=M0ITQ6_9EURY|nr:hypothetical protein [Haloferax mucosum]ELZ98864.1 hypothetical protein C440_00870 [Haloferax mucosum ATCC BAA-1512]